MLCWLSPPDWQLGLLLRPGPGVGGGEADRDHSIPAASLPFKVLSSQGDHRRTAQRWEGSTQVWDLSAWLHPGSRWFFEADRYEHRKWEISQ